MKNFLLVTLLALLSLAYPLKGQTIQALGGVNYGNGVVVRETQGIGPPATSCTGLVRYTQIDALPGSNLWVCVTGTMIQQLGGNGGSGGCDPSSPTGQCVITKQVVTPNGQIVGSAITGYRVTLGAQSTIPADWTLDLTTKVTTLQSLLPGLSPNGSSGLAVATTCPVSVPVGTVCVNGQVFTPVTVSTLGPVSTSNKGLMRAVADGLSSSDCTTGGGTALAMCVSDGSVWAPFGAGGGSSSAALVSTATTSTSVPASQSTRLLRCNGTITVTLPVSPASGQTVIVKNVGSGTCTVVPGSGTIDSKSSYSIPAGYSAFPSDTFIWDPSTSMWNII